MRHFAGTALIFLLVTPASAGSSSSNISVLGHWLTEAGDGIVEIKMCEDDKPCGVSTWVDPEHGVLIDSKNPDEELNGRPLLGSKIIWGFKPKGDRWIGGKIYNPKDGMTYSSKMAIIESGQLKVKGCVGPICKSLIWSRVTGERDYAMTSVSP